MQQFSNNKPLIFWQNHNPQEAEEELGEVSLIKREAAAFIMRRG